jgi:penicillin amidase
MVSRRGGLVRLAVLGVVAVALLAGIVPVGAAGVPADMMHAVNVVPVGNAGTFNSTTFAQNQATGASLGPNYADQYAMYRDWQYKPMQFHQSGAATHPGGRTDVSVYYDSFGVPQIYADTEVAMSFALGYTMARDRLFQMEAFRHAGHGTLAELTGASMIPSDEQTRRVSEGSAARLAELAAAPQRIRDGADAFTAGVNQLMTENCGPSVGGQHLAYLPLTVAGSCPAEFGLLSDTPVDWSNDDTLAFGEFAGRNFGEFDAAELTNAKAYVDMVNSKGQAQAEKAFNTLFPLDVPESPQIIPAADGLFPRHTGAPVTSSFSSSPFANHDPALLPSLAVLTAGATAIDQRALLVRRLQQQLGLPRWGSNAIVVSGRKTASHNPILYSGPQTGWAVPGFFWEVEVHTPERDTRGVTVPAIPLLVIGRNRDMGWSVTSAEGVNASTFVETLDEGNQNYLYKGSWHPLDVHQETITCHNNATDVLGLPDTSNICTSPGTTITVYRTVHGPALADPTSDHHLFTRQTTVDHRFVRTLQAWDDISKTHTAQDFGKALEGHYLGFNFFYADAHGDIAYFHTGRWPIWASNVDPNLPLKGTGEYDWQGEEPYSNNPHVINPSTGFLVNWNNKPAKQWWSPATIGAQNWGAYQQAVQLSDIVGASNNWTFDAIGQVPRQVAYTDHRARALAPYLVAALQGTSDPTLQQVLQLMSAYDLQRTDRGGGNMGPATVFFDRWLEYLNRDVFSAVLNTAADCNAYLDYTYTGTDTPCGEVPAHSFSDSNTSAAAHKFDQNSQDVLLRAFRGETAGPLNSLPVFGVAGANAAAFKAAREAAAELTSNQGSNPSTWSEQIEKTHFAKQGAGGVPDFGPLQNRGSYGQVIEPLVQAVAPASVSPAAGGTPTTGTAGVGLAGALMLIAALVLLLSFGRPARE